MLGTPDEAGYHWIQRDVARHLEEVSVALNEHRVEPRLEEMTNATVTSIVTLRIYAVHLTHADRDVAVGSLDEKMVMIRHQAVRVTEPPTALDHSSERRQEGASVDVVADDPLPSVAASGDVVDGARVRDAKRPSHRREAPQ